MTGLLVIDIQNFYEKKLVNFHETCENASKVINLFRDKKLPVFYIQHIKELPVINKVIPINKIKTLNIHKSVRPLEDEIIIQKYFINSFRETNLLELLNKNKIKKIVVCGMMTHMCVDAAVRALNDYGFEVEVIADACTTKDLKYKNQIIKAIDVHNTILAAFEYGYAKVTDTNKFIN